MICESEEQFEDLFFLKKKVGEMNMKTALPV